MSTWYIVLPLIALYACAHEDCWGPPSPAQVCTEEFDPVCGCDGNTYDNLCELKKAGIKSWRFNFCHPSVEPRERPE